MPERCDSCGENAVIEDDVAGVGTQKICVECGTIASGIKIENTFTVQVKEDGCTFFGVKVEPLICEFCGDPVPLMSQSDVKICSECQQLQFDQIDAEPQPEPQRYTTEQGLPDRICKSCLSINLGMESLGADDRLVCRDCGTVAGSEDLRNDELEVRSRPYRNKSLTLPTNACRPRKLQGRVAGQEKIAVLHDKLRFPDIIKEEALEMFNQVFDKRPVFYMHISTKEHVAAACMFIVCRQHNVPVSLTHFKKYVGKFAVFLRGMKIVLKCLNIHLPHMSLSVQVEHVLSHCGFTSLVISKAKDIIFLCRQAWLTQGRSREGLIVIAAYYAYISSDPCTGFISMTKFRRKFKFPNLSLILQGEVNNMLLTLASSIPWLYRRTLKLSSVHSYIDDILKYQNTLLHLAFKSPDTDPSKQNVPETYNEMQKRYKRRCTRKTNSTITDNIPNCDSVNEDDLLPSMLKRQKTEVLKMGTASDLDCPDIKESEFDEEEISSYLHSPEEEEQIRRPKLKLMYH